MALDTVNYLEEVEDVDFNEQNQRGAGAADSDIDLGDGGSNTGNGGVDNDTPPPTDNTTPTPPTINDIPVSIISNISNANIYVNDTIISSTTPTIYNIKKTELFTQVERKIIRVEKNGYVSNERYEFYLETLDGSPIEDYQLNIIDGDFIGLESLLLKVDYYVDNELQEIDFDNQIDFTLTEQPTDGEEETKRIRFFLSGDANSVSVIREIDNQQFTIEQSLFIDDEVGTQFSIKSIDTSNYRLYKIDIVYQSGETETIESPPQQSINTSIYLEENVTLNLYTEKLIYTTVSNSEIIIPSTQQNLQYNINSDEDIVLQIRKNSDTKTVTVFVGNQSLEINVESVSTTDNPIREIVIPKSFFTEIGKYNVKIIPYSIQEINDFRQSIENIDSPIEDDETEPVFTPRTQIGSTTDGRVTDNDRFNE